MVLDINTNKVLISRDVVFHEHIFPFATLHSAPSTNSFLVHLSISTSSSTSLPAQSLPSDYTHAPAFPTSTPI